MSVRFTLRLKLVTAAALAGAVAAAACGSSTEAPKLAVPRADLNGDFVCVSSIAYYNGPSGLGYYKGSCNAYLSRTNPSRADSIDTAPFTILSTNAVRRVDFPGATMQYDSTSGVVVLHYSARPDEVYQVGFQSGSWYLERDFPPFDFTGDGQIDSLRLFFAHP
jgi:hypothetical protein